MNWKLLLSHLAVSAATVVVVGIYKHFHHNRLSTNRSNTAQKTVENDSRVVEEFERSPERDNAPEFAAGTKQSPEELEGETEIETFCDFAARKLLGDAESGAPVNDCLATQAQLKHIAALYLRANITDIHAAISAYRLADLFLSFLSHHVSESSTIKGLSLAASSAFVRDAESFASNHSSRHSSRSLSSSGRYGSDSSRQEGGVYEGNSDIPPSELHHRQLARPDDSATQVDTQHALARLGPNHVQHKVKPGRKRSHLFPGRKSPKFLANFGFRTFLMYLMQELEALLTEYLGNNWHHMDLVRMINSRSFHPLPLQIPAARPASVSGASSSRKLIQTFRVGSESTSTASSSANLQFLPPPSGRPSQHPAMSSSPGTSAPVQKVGSSSFSSISSDDERQPSAASIRARRNWQRARQAYVKYETVRQLSPKRVFLTMAQLLQELHKTQSQNRDRDPIFLFLGGGMAAGKSTVRMIIGSDEVWSKLGSSAVVIEADAVKNRDVVLQELRASGLFQHDGELAQFVHEYSTRHAQGALVAAVNEQKDIIFDGTCSWEPFVRQTVNMVRDHDHRYQLGPGYQRLPDGSILEEYWQRTSTPVSDGPGDGATGGPPVAKRRPYRIELVGVTCSPELAVARGFWRLCQTGRGVPVDAQLRSFKLFSHHWSQYCRLVDSATLYHTGMPPPLPRSVSS